MPTMPSRKNVISMDNISILFTSIIRGGHDWRNQNFVYYQILLHNDPGAGAAEEQIRGVILFHRNFGGPVNRHYY
jgi:hypothetical protein